MAMLPTVPAATPATFLRAALLATAIGRIARGVRRAPAVGTGRSEVGQSEVGRSVVGQSGVGQFEVGESELDVTVVIPARNEADRVEPCIQSLLGRGTTVLVIDDESTDATKAIAAAAGATVIDAGPLPAGWAGKAHALQVGLEAATTGVVIAVDADTRAAPGFVTAMVDALGDHLLVTGGTKVDAPDRLGRLVHASMLATLLYRLGPPGVPARRPERTMANGQCMVMPRERMLATGGFTPVSGNLVEDLALARHLAGRGERVAFVDATAVLTVQGYGSAIDTLRGWGRSLALREVTSTGWAVADLAVVWSTMALPLPRLLAGRGDALDFGAMVLRLGVVAATASAFRQRGWPLMAAPLADPVTAVLLTAGALRPSTQWRGRSYG